MKMGISRVLFWRELELLFLTKEGLAQFSFIQFILWFSSRNQARDLFSGSGDWWSSYILIRGFCQALLLNAVVSLDLFVKPKTDKTIEMLLSTGLSPKTIVASGIAVSTVFSAVSLLIYFCVLAAFIGRFSFGWVHLLSFSVLMLANLVVLVWTGFFALQTKHGSQLAGGLILASVILLFASGYYQYGGTIAPSFQLALGAGMGAAAAVSARVFRLFDKEKILLS